MTDSPLFDVGDRVLMDNKVPGTIDGFYTNLDGQTSAVVRLDWKWGKTVWGVCRGSGLEGEEIKLSAFSVIIVHPSNLSPMSVDLGEMPQLTSGADE